MKKIPVLDGLTCPPELIHHSSRPTRPPQRVRGRFLKGPVPFDWLSMAAKLPGRAFHVGILLWFLAGMTARLTVTLTGATTRSFGLDRDAKSRALRSLEAAGLVTVRRRPGQNPDVTIILPDDTQ